MSDTTIKTSPLVYARVAGLLYLTVAILGGFAFFLGQSFVVPGDAAATANNIVGSESLFRFGFVSGLIAQTFQILLVLALYKLLKAVNKNHALLMVIFSLVGIPIAMLNLLNQFAALLLLSGADYLAVLESGSLHTLAMFYLELHAYGITIAQIFWGLWLLPLGYLIFESGFIPKILGGLLIIGGLGYLIDFFIFFIFPDLNLEISQFTFIGELLLPLWLLIKGVNMEQWEKRALESN
jgi:hypothetical protein